MGVMKRPQRKSGESITIGGMTLTPDELAAVFEAAGNPMLAMEAIASTAMSRAPRAQTYHLCNETCCGKSSKEEKP